jgi:hypothetical protein
MTYVCRYLLTDVSRLDRLQMEAPGGVEPPTFGLGNRCSIQLSYGAKLLRKESFDVRRIAGAMEPYPNIMRSASLF